MHVFRVTTVDWMYVYRTQSAAMKAARQARAGGDFASVDRIEIAKMPLRKLIVACLNGEGFASGSTLIADLKPKREDRTTP